MPSEFRADRIDDLLQNVFLKLLSDGQTVGTSRGATRELFGVLLRLDDPRARLSRTEKKGTVFSAIGEFLWYLAKSNALDFIFYYAPPYAKDADEDGTIHGAYGPRLFKFKGIDQVANIISLLRRKPSSRRAVIQLFDAADLEQDFKEIPCTCTLQFVIRDNRLNMLTSMRSNDAYWGLPHDVFTFTMIQELLARSLGVEVGTYQHAVGSLHFYEDRITEVEAYINEAWQEKVPMSPMPIGDPWEAVDIVLKAEAGIREGQDVAISELELEPYWKDILRLLEIYRCFKTQQTSEISRIQKLITTRSYDPYIEKKKITTAKKHSNVPQSKQLLLFPGRQ